MSKVKAIAKNLKMSPYKIRRVANIVRGLDVLQAEQLLESLPHKGATLLNKVVKSARANAVNNNKWNENELVLSEIQINEGPMMKRFQARARGRIFPVISRTSHISVSVTSKGEN